jgi:hypothetical protein
MEEVEVDPPKKMEIRVKVVCTSICRSDVNQWENKVTNLDCIVLIFILFFYTLFILYLKYQLQTGMIDI